MKIGIIVAMDKEFDCIKGLLNDPKPIYYENRCFIYGTLGYNTIIITLCGIGKVNSAIGTYQLIQQFHPDVIISTGVAGGASPKLEIQDVVVSTETCYHDVYFGSDTKFGQVIGMPERFKTHDQLMKTAISLNCGCNIHSGLIVTGDWFVDTVDKMSDILSHFPEALAVDMESAAIAQVCHMENTAFVVFRIISDIPLKEDNAQQYADFWTTLADKSFNATKAFLEAI
ncbi:MAG: 5'-methylthioadenosine/adenosylhomocysteine nucleosidase [Prevotella sp.]|nr:5'-methylthioadenosine/adenosylhomocysteine nucleosidase [Prevotella sp.]